ncbi:ABC transporter substrate-binding protein [Glutamicibacter sp. JC586]|uniref:ABC transporter substrate-binding protein n=1 Tax=Glutamicibacter sp. JC586 TaxID=2590552 RepID=UPI00135CD64D|nr:ABC transporter substrate-binding protein [Glutamicibacter sp. JC586]
MSAFSNALTSRGSTKRQRRTFKTTGTLLALAGLLAVSACSGPSATTTDSTDGTIKVGVGALMTNLDPAQNFSIATVGIANLFGGTLTTLNPDGKDVSMGLAESVTEGDDQYVVKLKKGLKFSDGSALTAKDVEASFKHYLADETNGYGYTLAPIKKVTATDDLTVTFDLKYPYPSLGYALSLPGSIIVPASEIKARGQKLYQGEPLPSSGKFKIQKNSPTEMILEANENYPAPAPETKTIVFQKVVDPVSRLAQVQSGQLDYAEEIAPKQIPQLTDPVEARATYAANGQSFMVLNNRKNSVLSDANIRKAISAATDREQINKIVSAGMNRMGLGLFASQSDYNTPFLKSTADIEAAKAFLKGTKCENGCSLRFITSGDSDSALIVQQNLKPLGIDVKIENIEQAVFNQAALDGNFDILASGNFEQGDYPAISLQFTLGPTIEALRSGYENPKMLELLERLKVESGDELAATLEQVKTLFEEDLPLVPIADFMVVSASRIPAEDFGLNANLFYHVR